MNQLAKSTDVWKPASHEDQIKALILLGTLPAREADDTTVDKAAYYLALDGVRLHGLQVAVRAILQGALGHVFFPNPAELRIQCDKAMQHHVWMRDRIARQEQMRRERPPERGPLSPEERERQIARMQRFHGPGADEQAELAAIRAKYDPAALAAIPDAPLPQGWAQVGGASPKKFVA